VGPSGVLAALYGDEGQITNASFLVSGTNHYRCATPSYTAQMGERAILLISVSCSMQAQTDGQVRLLPAMSTNGGTFAAIGNTNNGTIDGYGSQFNSTSTSTVVSLSAGTAYQFAANYFIGQMNNANSCKCSTIALIVK
jgi:hypothetical protein